MYEHLDVLERWIAKEPRVNLIKPETSMSFIKLDIPQDDRSFCINLLKLTGVLLVPGSAFGVPQHVRLGYCCKQEVLHQGLKLLSQYLRRFEYLD